MEVLVVFLPLLAFLVAGSIALFGGPKAEPVPAGHGHGHDHGHGHGHDDHAHISHDELHDAHDDAHDDHHVVAGPPTPADRTAQFVTAGAVLVSAVLSWILFFDVAVGGHPRTIELMSWIRSGSLDVSWALRIDQLTAVMLVVVNTVSAMVHVYSVGYMAEDPQKPRFMGYLSLFTFAMLMLVTADNLVQLFFGWEGVGLASYLLINFWYEKPSANNAAIKAFLVNRVGDFGFALGIFAIFVLTNSVQFDAIFAKAPDLVGQKMHFLSWNVDALTVTCLLLFMGAMGKSAQLGLHTWLPDAMEGPTPVSALIHAATMVTAGVFMVCRLSPVFEYAPTALEVVTVVGALTAFVAATIGFTQFDIKRVIAYSTMSQLGYMFFAAGVSAYGAAMFHLFTHAFFKALLFLGAGSVIHALHHEQDMRKMGGVWRKIPFTYAVMWIGNLALAGLPIFAGYYSKDMILEAAFASASPVGKFAFALGIAAALLTAFYSWRLLFMTFHGKPRMDKEVYDHAHESPIVMLIPLAVLALGALFAGIGFHNLFIGHDMDHFWGKALLVLHDNNSIEAAHHHTPTWVALAPLVVGLIGIALAYIMYMAIPSLPAKVAGTLPGLHQFLYKKWYFDELYDILFVRTAKALGYGLWKSGDGAVIDGVGPDGVAAATRDVAARASRLQSGYVYHYAFAMVIGVVLLVAWLSMFG
ncbi:NADH-quinone oxidoreductase subunit L [Azospirillum rugosum]|uniref:NADH-quinone oxidoreductase subunit L n=1 Tax=Azospirillum rugosum TaxID=416170 RepID=A0ABS4SFU4_9PROT|nr:NADH-quinone oxidoreductase subunit L [Azospirillum rugosum]MBP2291079.1 NADH-quinone oxidoreductase subunit L [Azospirillum rugosum]MDQ0524857.1 NADH-quinone oxidoreductase subunit L [Azospirillum rugosum]